MKYNELSCIDEEKRNQLIDLLKRIFVKDPLKRIKITEILNHNLFKEVHTLEQQEFQQVQEYPTAGIPPNQNNKRNSQESHSFKGSNASNS